MADQTNHDAVGGEAVSPIVRELPCQNTTGPSKYAQRNVAPGAPKLEFHDCNKVDSGHPAIRTDPNSATVSTCPADTVFPCLPPPSTPTTTITTCPEKRSTDTGLSTKPWQPNQPPLSTAHQPAKNTSDTSDPLPTAPGKGNSSTGANEAIEMCPVDSGAALREEKNDPFHYHGEITYIPTTNLAIACMVTLCFNLPFGLVAVYLSLRATRAFQQDETELGQTRSRWSIIVSLLGITITTAIVSSIVLYIAIQGQKRIKRHKGMA